MNVEELAARLVAGERRALAKAITLIEGNHQEQRAMALQLLQLIPPTSKATIRIGLTGAPGVGKSTLIERMGMSLIELGHRVAVLAIDPSSQVSGGSIMGDKVRMPDLSANDQAFIRPSPSSGVLGGVTRHSRESIWLCEAAGFDVVIVETVGVGQSETSVADMVDCLILMVMPHGGDEMQGVKKGVMEMADIVVVHKADGALLDESVQAQRDYGSALSLVRRKYADWPVPVLRVSSLTGVGIDELWENTQEFRRTLMEGTQFQKLREQQARLWFRSALQEEVLHRLNHDPWVQEKIETAISGIDAGHVTPYGAANQLVREWLDGGLA